MKFSEKLDPPPSFDDWKRGQIHAGIPLSFIDLQQPQKGDVRNSLMGEQNFLCAYCGRRLNRNFSNSHIDHFWPQSHFHGSRGDDGVCRPDRRLDYSNFFLSCGPASLLGAESLPRTCGDAKGNWFDEGHHIMPSDETCEARFKFSDSGNILPNDTGDVSARNMIEKLNLNDEGLASDRRKLIQEIEEILVSQDPDEKLEQMRSWCEPDDAGAMAGFAQVARRYFEEESGMPV